MLNQLLKIWRNVDITVNFCVTSVTVYTIKCLITHLRCTWWNVYQNFNGEIKQDKCVAKAHKCYTTATKDEQMGREFGKCQNFFD